MPAPPFPRRRALSFEDGHHVVEVDRGERLRARTVVLATGASYRRLSVANLAAFEGAGVYYAATQVEAQMCTGNRVVVVGGGNSAGQAAVFLAKHVSHVDLVVRRGDLGAGMSRYLVDQVEAAPGIEVHVHAELRALLGDGTLEAVTLEDTSAGTTETLPVAAAFVFIGADPRTSWLGDALVTDDDGFVVTGDALQLTHLDPAGDGRQRVPVCARDQPPGRLRRRRRAVRLDQARRLRGGRGRDGGPDAASVSGVARRTLAGRALTWPDCLLRVQRRRRRPRSARRRRCA